MSAEAISGEEGGVEVRRGHRRRKYDSFVVWLFNNDKEHLLPDPFVRSIPNSTRSYWKREVNYSSYCGSEFRYIQERGVRYAELFQDRRHLERLVLAIVSVWTKLSDILLPVIQKKEEYSERFVEELQRIMQFVPRRTVLEYTGISSSFFHERIARIKVKCDLSPVGDCLRRHPLQLSPKEVGKIRELFRDPRFACWPVSSLYFEGLRNRGLHIGKSSFYKYARVLGLKRDLCLGKRRGSASELRIPTSTSTWTRPSGRSLMERRLRSLSSRTTSRGPSSATASRSGTRPRT